MNRHAPHNTHNTQCDGFIFTGQVTLCDGCMYNMNAQNSSNIKVRVIVALMRDKVVGIKPAQLAMDLYQRLRRRSCKVQCAVEQRTELCNGCAYNHMRWNSSRIKESKTLYFMSDDVIAVKVSKTLAIMGDDVVEIFKMCSALRRDVVDMKPLRRALRSETSAHET